MKPLPVQKVGKNCYQWGNQKVYCGNGAKAKAIKQGIAIENTGWKEAEEIDLTHVPSIGLIIPNAFGGVESKRKMWLRNGHHLIGTTKDGKWAVYDLDENDFIGWNYVNSPLNKYWDLKNRMPKDDGWEYHHLLSFEDALILSDWMKERELETADDFFKGGFANATGFMTDSQRRALRYRMTDEEKRMSRSPNRSNKWIPNRLIEEKTDEVKEQLECKKCGAKRFGSIVAAKRHQFYCDKYGAQPSNGLFMTPLELHLYATLSEEEETKEAEFSQTPILLIATMVALLGITIPYFLDSRGNKV